MGAKGAMDNGELRVDRLEALTLAGLGSKGTARRSLAPPYVGLHDDRF
jgi:hypothetical protein